MIQLYFTAPGAGKNHEWVTQFDMSGFTPGQWNTATFTLPLWVVDILKGNDNDLVLGMALNPIKRAIISGSLICGLPGVWL